MEDRLSGDREHFESKVEAVRERVVDALCGIDTAELVRKPQLEARFIQRVGLAQGRLQQSELDALRARLRWQGACRQMHATGHVDCASVDAEVEAQMLARERLVQMKRQAREVILQRQQNLQQVGESGWRELLAIHRVLVARLHPFLNPTGDQDAKRKLSLVRLALKRGDVQMMRSLEVITREHREGAQSWRSAPTIEELNAELAIAQAQASVMEGKLNDLLQGWQFELESQLDDASWVDAHNADVERRIGEADVRAQEYRARLAELLGKVA